MAAAQWALVACDGSGNALAELTRAAGVSLTFTRNGVPECTFSLSHDDNECALILTALTAGTGGGVPTLKGYRLASGSTTKVLRFNGYLSGISEESGTEASTATFTFRGPFGRLLGDGNNKGRFLGHTQPPAHAFSATDAGQIAKALVDDANLSNTSGVVTTGSIDATKLRDRSYPDWQNLGDAVVGLTAVLDGFDFEVVPVDQGATQGVFTVYAKQGSNQLGAKFEYGSGTLANCAAVHRQTLPPINYVTVVGANGLTSTQQDATSVAKYGRFEYLLIASDVSEQTTLDDKAFANLRPNPVKTLDFTPDPRLAPAPWDDYWIGDTVYFYANRGALVEGPSAIRVNQITVVIDPDTGLETDTITDSISPDDERVLRAGLQAEILGTGTLVS